MCCASRALRRRNEQRYFAATRVQIDELSRTLHSKINPSRSEHGLGIAMQIHVRLQRWVLCVAFFVWNANCCVRKRHELREIVSRFASFSTINYHPSVMVTLNWIHVHAFCCRFKYLNRWISWTCAQPERKREHFSYFFLSRRPSFVWNVICLKEKTNSK